MGFLGAKKAKSLKKSRAARARKTPNSTNIRTFSQYQNSALDNAKSEDPAKMTHSIPDLSSLDGVCARNFRESFAKVAVSSCERKKGKLR